MITGDLTIKGRGTGTYSGSNATDLPLYSDIAAAFSNLFQGNWTANQFYYLGQWVVRNGGIYRAKQDNQNSDPATSPEQWLLILQATGPQGAAGASSYTYTAYASAADGTGFTETFDAALNYIAIRTTNTAIAERTAEDFAGLWKNYKGATGAAGATGSNGASAFLYIAYASAADGTGFSNTFNAALNYIAVKTTTTALVSPQASDFAGLWKQYAGALTFAVSGALTFDGTTLGLNAASAATANYLVQRDGNGSFAANKIALGGTTPAADHLTFAGAATLGYYNSAFTFSAGIAATALAIGNFTFNVVSGALQLGNGSNVAASTDGTALTVYALKLANQSAGFVRCGSDGTITAGAATTDALPEGATNIYFTPARVLATPLTALNTSAGGAIAATDTVLAALGKIQNQLTALGGQQVTLPFTLGNFRVDANGNVLLKFPDATWHRITLTQAQGQYVWDINQAAN